MTLSSACFRTLFRVLMSSATSTLGDIIGDNEKFVNMGDGNRKTLSINIDFVGIFNEYIVYVMFLGKR